jgi:hypothetical protein
MTQSLLVRLRDLGVAVDHTTTLGGPAESLRDSRQLTDAFTTLLTLLEPDAFHFEKSADPSTTTGSDIRVKKQVIK